MDKAYNVAQRLQATTAPPRFARGEKRTGTKKRIRDIIGSLESWNNSVAPDATNPDKKITLSCSPGWITVDKFL